MKLNDATLAVLKNFATINDSLMVQPGKIQKTINLEGTVMAEAIIADDFPQEFGIYDLQQFLSNYTTLDNPELTFDETYLSMGDKNISLKYFYCAPNLLTKPPAGAKLDASNPDVTFKFGQDILQKLLKIGSLNNLTSLVVEGKGKKLTIKILDSNNDSSNQAEYELGDYEGEAFNVSFNVDNLKMVPADYNVKLNLKAGFALFSNHDGSMQYFIAPEKKKGKKS